MDTSMESFHHGGVKRGGLVRRRGAHELHTLVCYRRPDGIVRAESRIEHPGDVRAWTRCLHESGQDRLELTRDGDVVTLAGSSVQVPGDTVPSYAGCVLLEDMLAASATEIEFHRVEEDGGDIRAQQAHFSVGNPENLVLPGRRAERLGVVDLFVDGRARHRFWFDSHDVVASDWGDGARSYRVATLEALLDGLDAQVAAQVRGFFALPVG